MSRRQVLDSETRTRRLRLAGCVLMCNIMLGSAGLAANAAGTADGLGLSISGPAVATESAATAPTSEPGHPAASQLASQPVGRPASQPATAPSSQPREADITAETVQILRKRAEGADNLSPAEKGKIVDLYDQALKQLELARDWQTQAQAFDAARLQASAQTEQAKTKLAQPVEDLTPHYAAQPTLQQLEQSLSQAEQERSAAYADRSSLEAARKTALQREVETPKRIAAIRQQRADIADQLAAHGEGSPELEQARKAFLQAQRTALRQESIALTKHLACDRAGAELLTHKQDLAARYVQETVRVCDLCKQAIEAYSAKEVERSAERARQERIARAKDRPEIRAIAEQNEQLAGQRLDLQKTASRIQGSSEILSLSDLYQLRNTIQGNYDSMVKKIEAAGLTEAVSSLLRRHRASCPIGSSTRGSAGSSKPSTPRHRST